MKKKKKAKKKKTSKKSPAQGELAWKAYQEAIHQSVAKDAMQPPPPPYVPPKPKLDQIFALDASHIPDGMDIACLDINDEFPLHYDTGIVRIPDNGNPFSEWLKTIGFKFTKTTTDWKTKKPQGWDYLAVWGT